MDIAAASLEGPRADTRYRRWTPSIRSHERPRRETHRKEGHPRGASDAPTGQKEKERQRGAMTKDHRLYHRRQAEAAAATKTIGVEVVATVDNNGNVVGQETKTRADPAAPTLGMAVAPPPAVVPAAPAVVDAVPSAAAPPAESLAINALNDIAPAQPAPPAPVSPAVPPAVPVPAVPTLPQVPAMPTAALPVVPSVPPFPSDLTVPGYPYASGVPVVANQVSSGSVTPSPAPTSVPGSSAIPASLSSVPLLGSNSTITSTSSFSSTASRASGSSVYSSKSAFDSVSVSVAAFTRSSSSDAETATSYFSSITASPPAAGTNFYGGVGNGGSTSTAADPALATAGAGGNSPGSTSPLQTPQVVGSVVGSLAGAALILAIILLLLQRHKRQRRGALQLTNDETTERSPPMVQDASRGNRIPSAFLNRFSGISRSTVETSTSAGEKSFQRVSGRKLPSAFSEGMTSEQFARGTTLSGSSFYTDDQGTYGGPGLSKEFGKEGGATPIAAGMMNIRPGPARTPIIRHPSEDNVNPFDDPTPFPRGGPHLSPPQSPNPDAPRSTLGRSLQSADGSRSSKFTENV